MAPRSSRGPATAGTRCVLELGGPPTVISSGRNMLGPSHQGVPSPPNGRCSPRLRSGISSSAAASDRCHTYDRAGHHHAARELPASDGGVAAPRRRPRFAAAGACTGPGGAPTSAAIPIAACRSTRVQLQVLAALAVTVALSYAVRHGTCPHRPARLPDLPQPPSQPSKPPFPRPELACNLALEIFFLESAGGFPARCGGPAEARHPSGPPHRAQRGQVLQTHGAPSAPPRVLCPDQHTGLGVLYEVV